MSKDKDLISVIEGMLDESLTEAEHNHHNKKAYDVVTNPPKAHNASPDTQGVVGGSNGGVSQEFEVDTNKNKGEHSSDASDNSKEVGIGAKDGQVLDAGGDKDVGKQRDGKTAMPSGASGECEADKGPHDQGSDKFKVKEDEEVESEEAVSEEEVAEKCDDDEDDKKEAYESDCDDDDEDEMEEACSTKEELHGDQDKLDHNNNGKIDADDMKKVRKHGPVKEDEEAVEEAEGETLKTVNSSSNEKQRPEQEKGDNAPKTSGDQPNEGPHDQEKDEKETKLKAEEVTEEEIEDYIDSLSEEEQSEILEMFEIDEALEKDGPNKSKDIKFVMGKSDQAKNYLAKKVQQRKDMNAKNDPGAAKKGYALSVTDKEKAAKKQAAREDVEMTEDEMMEESFKEKAAIIFETTVNEKVMSIREEMEVEFDERLEEAKVEMNAKIDSLVEEAVQEWIAENQLEIKYSLRTEIAENFIHGLKNLFQENYIEIPDEDISVVDELTETVEALKEQLEEQATQLEEANQVILTNQKSFVVEEVCEGLTETQKIKLEKLAEAVEADDIDEFEYKLTALKESYFTDLATQIVPMAEEIIEESAPVAEDTSANFYAQWLSRSIK